jgi:hypothetical protein
LTKEELRNTKATSPSNPHFSGTEVAAMTGYVRDDEFGMRPYVPWWMETEESRNAFPGVKARISDWEAPGVSALPQKSEQSALSERNVAKLSKKYSPEDVSR